MNEIRINTGTDEPHLKISSRQCAMILDELINASNICAENNRLKLFIRSWGEEIRTSLAMNDNDQLRNDADDFQEKCKVILKDRQDDE